MPKKFTNKSLYEWLVEQVQSHNSDECLIWPFAKDPNGYGRVSVAVSTADLVHRIAFRIANGRDPNPCALHRCDNPPCFNPRHLFEGTQLENIADMDAKGRHRGGSLKGEAHNMVILTEEQVRQIRAEYVPYKMSAAKLAPKFGVTRATITDIVTRRSWKHLP